MNPFVIFWGVLIFSSIAWYAVLLFYIGYKGGCEIQKLSEDLSKRNQAQDDADSDHR